MPTSAEVQFESLLADASSEWGMSVSAKDPKPQPILETSCGVVATYGYLRLVGAHTSLQALISMLGEGSGGPSVADL
jgi:hypothetical protein